MVKNILVTAAGSPGFITVQKAIRSTVSMSDDLVIHGCDMNPDSIGLKMCDESFVSFGGSSSRYVANMLEYCTKNNIDLIIPCSDEELLPLSRYKHVFESKGCGVLVPSEESLLVVLNKSKLFKFCTNRGMERYVPKHYSCNNEHQLLNAYEELTKNGYNACVKPAQAHGSRGFRVISNRPCSRSDFLNKKVDSYHISIDDLCKTLSCTDDSRFPELLVMEYLSGVEYSVDCFKRQNDFLCIPRTREIIKDGICVFGTVTENKELMSASEELYNELKLEYNANLQFKYDDHEEPKLLEINPRFSGTMEHCRAAGVNLVEVALHEILGIEHLSYDIKWGTEMTRVWKEVFRHGDALFCLGGH